MLGSIHWWLYRLLKGAFHARPSLPRYTDTWNVQVVLDCILQWGDTTSQIANLQTSDANVANVPS